MKLKNVGKKIFLLGVLVFAAGIIVGVFSATQDVKMICTVVFFSGVAIACIGYVIMIVSESFRFGWRSEPVLAGVMLCFFSSLFSYWAVCPEAALRILGYTHF